MDKNTSSDIEKSEAATDENVTIGELQENFQATQKSKHNRKKWIILVLILFIVLATGAGYYKWHKRKNTSQPVSKTEMKQTIKSAPKLCFIRLSHLVCTDGQGKNRVRYDLPLLPEGQQIDELITDRNQSFFVAHAYHGAQSSVWTLDGSLKSEKQLHFPSDLIPSHLSLSLDGKSILLELSSKPESADLTRHVYRYTIETKKLTQLTTKNINSSPQETRSGKILYSSYEHGSNSWLPHVMDKDEKNQRVLPGISDLKIVSGTSYDEPSDTLYVFGTTVSGEDEILHGKFSDVLTGKKMNVLYASASNSSYSIARLDESRILIDKLNEGQIVDITSGKQLGIITQYGVMVGWLSTDAFTRSVQQEEQPYERIIGLSSAPEDFQVFIKKEFDQKDAACAEANPSGGIQFKMTIEKVVRDSFADVAESCAAGTRVYYVNAGSLWKQAFKAQMTPTCDVLDQYKFTKEIWPQCYNDKDQLVANINP